VSALRIYRDDGPLAAWISAKLALASRERAEPHPLAWLVPPLLRTVEYGSLIALTATAEPDALPLCFALIGVLALHQYETAYRLRQGLSPPSPWIRAVGAGWEGRLLVAGLLALGGWLDPGLLAATVVLGLIYAAESIASWRRVGDREQRALPLGDEGDLVE
jgi:Family of unknown function (DUF5941)